MESLREIFEKNENARKSRRGSVFITLVIILIIAFTAAFYIKTSKPTLFEKAKECMQNAISGITAPPAPEGADTAVLRSADTLFLPRQSFDRV